MTQTELRALIERITEALGSAASPERVESVARAVLNVSGTPAIGVSPGSGPISGRILITAYGCDQPGILAGVTQVMGEAGANVLDVSQKILQNYFTLIMLADLEGARMNLGQIRERLTALARTLGVQILVQHEEIFHAMHRP
jgi:ACT domain-containing protein